MPEALNPKPDISKEREALVEIKVGMNARWHGRLLIRSKVCHPAIQDAPGDWRVLRGFVGFRRFRGWECCGEGSGFAAWEQRLWIFWVLVCGYGVWICRISITPAKNLVRKPSPDPRIKPRSGAGSMYVAYESWSPNSILRTSVFLTSPLVLFSRDSLPCTCLI